MMKEYYWLPFLMQIGFKEESSNRWNDAWWFNAYDNAAKKTGGDSDSDSDSDKPKVYTGILYC